jgi:hypothetical protein
MLIGREHSSILEALSKLKYDRVVKLAIIASLFSNIGHAFQYQINSGDQFIGGYGDDDVHVYDSYPLVNANGLSFPIYELVYFIIDYGFFLLVNTCVEVAIVRKLHAELTEKRRKLAQMAAHAANSQNQAKVDSMNEKERRAVLMVVLNSLLNFLLRLPEMFIFVATSNFLFNNDNILYEVIQSVRQLPILLIDLSYFCFILTFSTNCFIYYKFNDKFKKAFNN